MGNVYLISGSDDFSRKKRARELALQLAGNDPDDPGLEIITADSDTVKPDQLAVPFVESVQTPPFLTPRKLVWLKNLPDMELLSKSGPGEMILNTICAPVPEEIDIIVDGPGLDMRKSYAKLLKNAGIQIEIFNALQSGDKNYAESRRQTLENLLNPTGKKLDPQAMQYLLETVGGSSANLANEVEKLLLYTGDAPLITLADCEAITSRTPEAVGWEFTSAVTAGEASRALKLLDLLFVKDSDIIPLLASLSNEYQRYSKLIPAMRELGVTHASPRSFDNLAPDVKSRFPDNPLLKCHPFRAYKMCEAAQKLGGHKIAEKLAMIRDASCSAVSGGSDSRILMEQLILKLCRN